MKEIVIKSKIVGRGTETGPGRSVASIDLSAYALKSDLLKLETSFNDFLQGEDTDDVINRWKELETFLGGISESFNLLSILQGKADKATTLSGYGITDAYTKTNVDNLLKSYVTLAGSQTITGEKNFTGGLKVNGSPIYYDSTKKYWKLEGDLLVTGGVTMYGSDSSFTPSTIMDALLYDDATLGINSNGQLYVKGGAGGGINTTDLQNYLTQNSYLNVTSGDNRYLKLSGGDLKGVLTINTTAVHPMIVSSSGMGYKSYIAYRNGATSGEDMGSLGFNGKNVPSFRTNSTDGGKEYKLLHENNYSSFALPLSGGTLTNNSTILTLKRNNIEGGAWIDFYNNSGKLGAIGIGGSQSPVPNSIYFHDPSINKDLRVWHEGNDGSGSTLDADMLDGEQESTFAKWKSGIAYSGEHRHIGYAYTSDGWIASGAAMSFGASTNYFMQIQGAGNKAKEVFLYARYIYEGLYSDWKTIAFTDSNVASATKLQTARTIWGQSFDGTGNVFGQLYLNTSKIVWQNDASNYYIGCPTVTGGARLEYRAYSGHAFLGGNVGIGTENPQGKLQINHSTFSDGLILNRMVSGAGSSVRFHSGGTLLGSLGVNGSKIFEFAVNDTLKFTVDSNGNGLFYGGVTMYSDQRKKTILNHVELSLKQIANAPLIEHYYNSDDKKTTHVGSIAQYWASMNDWFCKLDSEGYYTMEIQNAALASAISIARELDRYETKTDKAIKKLKMRICELEEEIERLKSA